MRFICLKKNYFRIIIFFAVRWVKILENISNISQYFLDNTPQLCYYLTCPFSRATRQGLLKEGVLILDK